MRARNVIVLILLIMMTTTEGFALPSHMPAIALTGHAQIPTMALDLPPWLSLPSWLSGEEPSIALREKSAEIRDALLGDDPFEPARLDTLIDELASARHTLILPLLSQSCPS